MLLEPYTNRTTPAHKQPTMHALRGLALQEQDEVEALRRIIADNERRIAEQARRIAIEDAFQENYRRQQAYLRRTDIDDATKLNQVMGEWEAER